VARLDSVGMTTASEKRPQRGRGILQRLYHSRLVPGWMRRAYLRLRRRLVELEAWWRDRLVARLGEAESFTDKVRYKMSRDRRRLVTTFADKVAAREYIAATVGPQFLTELYLAAHDPEALQPAALPREFVVKASHGSGAVVVVSDTARPDAELPYPPAGWPRVMLRPERLDWNRLRALAAEWLGRRYRTPEWAYLKIPPRLIAEELLLEGGCVPPDHRVFVFNGRARLIQVDQGRFVSQTQAVYTPDWERIDARFNRPQGPDVPRPRRLADMLSAAETLGRETDLVRVDFYSLDTRLVIGELTNYPWGGMASIGAEADRQLGSYWRLPRRYTRREIARLATTTALEP
jgi:TupA-like ATPgrasp